MLFKVREKNSSEVFEVYAIYNIGKYDFRFLLYDSEKQSWIMGLPDNFIPC
jgi:hypothetical protein